MRTLAMPKAAELWSLTSLREKLIKIGAKVVSHGVADWPVAAPSHPRLSSLQSWLMTALVHLNIA